MRLLIYLFPALMDLVVGEVLFVCTIRAARMGASAAAVGGIITAWSAIYLVSCAAVGRLVTTRNAARLMACSCIGMAVLSCLLIVFPSLPAIYVLVPLIGASCAMFFPPFQVFMKAVDVAGGKTITHSTAMYTFSWSMGYAVGPFVAGFLMEQGRAEVPGLETGGWKYAHIFAAGAALVTLVGIRYLKHLAGDKPDSAVAPAQAQQADKAPHGPAIDYSRMPDLAWLGWCSAGVGVCVVSVVRGIFPSHAVSVLHMTDSTQGVIFFILSMAQGITGLALSRGRLWMYRPGPVVLFGAAGILGTLLFAVGRTPAMFYPAAALFGIYSGSFFFYLVFHALAHPSRSALYVSTNESVVGVCGIIGPLVGGTLTDRHGFALPCFLGAGLVAAVTAFQSVVHRRNPPDELVRRSVRPVRQ